MNPISPKSPKILNVRDNLFNTAIADILRALDGGAIMGSLVLAFCVIDYYAQVHKPSEGNKIGYTETIKDLLGHLNPRYVDIADEIYAVRNSLIHTYGESVSSRQLNLEFSVSINAYFNEHLNIYPSNEEKRVILIDVPIFLSEVICSADVLFSKYANNEMCFYQMENSSIKVFSENLEGKVMSDFHRHLHYFEKKLLIADVVKLLSTDIRNQLL